MVVSAASPTIRSDSVEGAATLGGCGVDRGMVLLIECQERK
jgi:hypothetical protein